MDLPVQCTPVKALFVAIGVIGIIGGTLSLIAIHVPVSSLNVLARVGTPGAIAMLSGGFILLCIAFALRRGEDGGAETEELLGMGNGNNDDAGLRPKAPSSVKKPRIESEL